MNATLRQPRIGVFTLATSSRRRSSASLGPMRTTPPVKSKTARRQPGHGRVPVSRSIRSAEKSAADGRGCPSCRWCEADSSPFGDSSEVLADSDVERGTGRSVSAHSSRLSALSPSCWPMATSVDLLPEDRNRESTVMQWKTCRQRIPGYDCVSGSGLPAARQEGVAEPYEPTTDCPRPAASRPSRDSRLLEDESRRARRYQGGHDRGVGAWARRPPSDPR